jgi:hypothetical protein
MAAVTWPYAADISISELRPTPIDRQFGAGRKGSVEREEANGLGDFVTGASSGHRA